MPDEPIDLPPEPEAAQLVRRAREAIRRASLRLTCRPAPDAGEARWQLEVQGEPIEGFPKGSSLRLWPVTVNPEQGSDGTSLVRGEGVLLGPLAPQSLTTLIGFEVSAGESSPDGPRVEPERFVLSLPETGLPHELRDAALTRQIVAQGDGFLRYLLLLLGDLDPESGTSSILGNIRFGGEGMAASEFEDLPIVEEMARAFARNPERLDEVARLIERLTAHRAAADHGESDGGHGLNGGEFGADLGADSGGSNPGNDGDDDVIPAQFRQVWRVFQQALEQDAERGR